MQLSELTNEGENKTALVKSPKFSLQTQQQNETSRQQEKDLKILQKCFNLSLERMHENYEGRPFLSNKDGSQSVKGSHYSASQKHEFAATTFSDYYSATINHGQRRLDQAFSLTANTIFALQEELSPTKPRTSAGFSREQIAQQMRLPDHRPIEDLGAQIKFMRESLKSSQQPSRPFELKEPMRADSGFYPLANAGDPNPAYQATKQKVEIAKAWFDDLSSKKRWLS